MTQETKAAIKILGTFHINGKVIDLKLARKEHTCTTCKQTIIPDSAYYHIVLAGSGLGSLKFPDRVHLRCIDKYLKF